MEMTAQLQNQAAAMLHLEEKQEMLEKQGTPEKQEEKVLLDAFKTQ